MPDLFGAPVGIETAEAGQRAQQVHDLSMQKGEVELVQAKIALSTQERMLQLMSGAGDGSGGTSPFKTDDLAGNMDALAQMAMASGNPDKAKDYATAGSTLRKNQVDLTDKKLSSDIKEMTIMSSLLDGVGDEAAWQRANAMYQIQTGKASPWARMPYQEGLVDKLKMGIQTAKDRALTAAAQAREKATIAEQKEREARIPLIRAQTQLAAERTTALKKAGAVSKVPKAGDLRAVTDLIAKDYGGSILPEDMRVLARPVAERMTDLMRTQKLSQSEAAARAYNEAKEEGAFGGVRPRSKLPGTVNRPMELPDDPKKLRPNMYYSKGGKTFLFTGQAFMPVGSGPGEVQEEEEFNEDTAPAVDESEEP